MEHLKYSEESGVFVLKNVILSYPHLFEAWAQDPNTSAPKFSASFLVDKDTHSAEIEYLQKHLLKLQKEKWKAKIPADRLCLRDGDLSGKPEEEGKWKLATSEKAKPATVDNRKRELTESDDKLYGGAVVNVMFKLWIQDNQKGGKRINANLLAVQFVRDGDRFGAPRPNIDDHLEEFGEDEDELGLDD